MSYLYGATAHALPGIVDAGNFPRPVRPGHRGRAAVHPPDQTQSRMAPYPFSACSKSGPVYLSVGPMQRGT